MFCMGELSTQTFATFLYDYSRGIDMNRSYATDNQINMGKNKAGCSSAEDMPWLNLKLKRDGLERRENLTGHLQH